MHSAHLRHEGFKVEVFSLNQVWHSRQQCRVFQFQRTECKQVFPQDCPSGDAAAFTTICKCRKAAMVHWSYTAWEESGTEVKHPHWPSLYNLLHLKLNPFSWCLFKHQLFFWLIVWNHVSTSLRSQRYRRTFFPDSLQTGPCYVPAEIHVERLQRSPVQGHGFQCPVSDPHAVLQFECPEVWAVLEEKQDAIICNVATSWQRQRQQVWTSENMMVAGEMRGKINNGAWRGSYCQE